MIILLHDRPSESVDDFFGPTPPGMTFFFFFDEGRKGSRIDEYLSHTVWEDIYEHVYLISLLENCT
jgi:hypothetical protein